MLIKLTIQNFYLIYIYFMLTKPFPKRIPSVFCFLTCGIKCEEVSKS